MNAEARTTVEEWVIVKMTMAEADCIRAVIARDYGSNTTMRSLHDAIHVILTAPTRTVPAC